MPLMLQLTYIYKYCRTVPIHFSPIRFSIHVPDCIHWITVIRPRTHLEFKFLKQRTIGQCKGQIALTFTHTKMKGEKRKMVKFLSCFDLLINRTGSIRLKIRIGTSPKYCDFRLLDEFSLCPLKEICISH